MLAKYRPYTGIKHQVNYYYLHGSNAGTNQCHDHELSAYNDALNTRTAYYSRVYLASVVTTSYQLSYGYPKSSGCNLLLIPTVIPDKL